jgi:hydrogenase expression/formation protein HypD
MQQAQSIIEAIHAAPLARRVRLMHLSGDQERVITQSGLRQLLPTHIDLVAGPGCPASVCPAADIHQAVSLASHADLTLFADESLWRIPGPSGARPPRSLVEAQAQGADVRLIGAPVEAVLAARADPHREMVLFVAGFETLLVPLAGMVLEGLPANLSLLVCGRHVDVLLDATHGAALPPFDALLLPGNRYSLLGLDAWERFAQATGRPVAIAGYTGQAVLAAVRSLVESLAAGRTEVLNAYRPMARPGGNPLARQRLGQVFEVVRGRWRGLGAFGDSAYRLRERFSAHDADRRYPDFRPEVRGLAELPPGCGCTDVLAGRRRPLECVAYNRDCRPERPLGPSMASGDGTCRIQSLAGVAGFGSVVAG